MAMLASRPMTSPSPATCSPEEGGVQNYFQGRRVIRSQPKRPALRRFLKKLEHGDTLTVWKLDRLGRCLRDLIKMLDDLKAQGVKFRSLTEACQKVGRARRGQGQSRREFQRESDDALNGAYG
jgi:DNA invertase Pin-like site-specific DNA recombinase